MTAAIPSSLLIIIPAFVLVIIGTVLSFARGRPLAALIGTGCACAGWATWWAYDVVVHKSGWLVWLAVVMAAFNMLRAWQLGRRMS